MARAGELGSPYLLALIPDVLADGSAPETARALLDSSGELTNQFSTAEQRSDLGKVLVQSFVAAPSVEVKNRLAKWIAELDNEALLKEVGNLGLTSEDIEILQVAMPGSKYLKKLVS